MEFLKIIQSLHRNLIMKMFMSFLLLITFKLIKFFLNVI